MKNDLVHGSHHANADHRRRQYGTSSFRLHRGCHFAPVIRAVVTRYSLRRCPRLWPDQRRLVRGTGGHVVEEGLDRGCEGAGRDVDAVVRAARQGGDLSAG
jgi:hypothetical protein